MIERRTTNVLLLAVVTLIGRTACAQAVGAGPQLEVDQVAARLEANNDSRKAALTSYESRRVMTVTYQGPLAQGEASETVSMIFHAPSTKQFTVLSVTGAQIIRDNVFSRALSEEQSAAADEAQQASALGRRNYTMTLVGQEKLEAGDCLILEVEPKAASEFTFSGRVWIQATDFAVVRIQGKPSVNPSPWTSEGEFTTDFQKIGDFYFPQKTVSSSKLPLGLHAQLTIQYGPYRILGAAPVRLKQSF